MSTTTTISKLLAVFLYTTFHAIAALIDIFIDATIWVTTALTERVEWLYNSNNRRAIAELINVYLDTCFRLDSGLAIVAWINSNPGSHHLDKTKLMPISYLHSFVSNSSDKNCIVFVRGLVRSNSPLVSSHCSQERTKGIALQKTEFCNGIQGLISGLRPKPSLERVPFVVSPEGDSDIYLNVKFKDSTHPLHFTTVNRYSQRTTYKFLGREYHVDKVIEEKMLQLDKEITAVGSIMSMRQLTNNALALLQRWLQERPVDQHRENVRRVRAGNVPQAFGRQSDHVAGVGTDEGLPEERLCVICLENRKAIAFFPCGHVVCCTTCASSVRQTLYPRCPLCRRFISYSLPVYL